MTGGFDGHDGVGRRPFTARGASEDRRLHGGHKATAKGDRSLLFTLAGLASSWQRMSRTKGRETRLEPLGNVGHVGGGLQPRGSSCRWPYEAGLHGQHKCRLGRQEEIEERSPSRTSLQRVAGEEALKAGCQPNLNEQGALLGEHPAFSHRLATHQLWALQELRHLHHFKAREVVEALSPHQLNPTTCSEAS